MRRITSRQQVLAVSHCLWRCHCFHSRPVTTLSAMNSDPHSHQSHPPALPLQVLSSDYSRPKAVTLWFASIPHIPFARPRPSDRPSTGHGLSIDPSDAQFGPYMSASARTSYTRIDVDSSPLPDYPPLLPLPTACAVQDIPVTTTPVPTNDGNRHPTNPSSIAHLPTRLRESQNPNL